jgi:hypothetical protein
MNLVAVIKSRFGSQTAFARAVGMHPVRINRICNGWIEPTAVERYRIAEALRADPGWLFAAFRVPPPKSKELESETAIKQLTGVTNEV